MIFNRAESPPALKPEFTLPYSGRPRDHDHDIYCRAYRRILVDFWLTVFYMQHSYSHSTDIPLLKQNKYNIKFET